MTAPIRITPETGLATLEEIATQNDIRVNQRVRHQRGWAISPAIHGAPLREKKPVVALPAKSKPVKPPAVLQITPMVRTEADMVEAYRGRIRQLGIAYSTVDAISGLPDRYTAKLMAPIPMKGLGEKAIEGLNGALGIAFVPIIDPEQVKRVEGRWVKRKRQPDKKVASALMLKPQVIPMTLEQLAKREQLKMWGQMGGKASAKKRMKTMKKRARQRIAAHAARARWAKHRASV
jgi:hypothetical protein